MEESPQATTELRKSRHGGAESKQIQAGHSTEHIGYCCTEGE